MVKSVEKYGRIVEEKIVVLSIGKSVGEEVID